MLCEAPVRFNVITYWKILYKLVFATGTPSIVIMNANMAKDGDTLLLQCLWLWRCLSE